MTAHRQIDVLIVDDDPEVRADLRTLFETQGLTCAEAGTGAEAIEVALLSPPRLALVDFMMPDGDGAETARALRANPRTRRAHVYMLTARTDPEAERAARRAGCEVFLTKPLEASALLEVVDLAVHG